MRSTLTSSLLLLGSFASAGPATAQSAVDLIGGAVQAGIPIVQRQRLCNQATPVCSPILALPTTAFAGGSAYDPNREVVWDTDGLRLTSVFHSPSPGPCRIACAPMPVPGVPAGTVATGLAYEEDGTSAGRLWCVDSGLGLQAFTWPTRSCPGAGPRCNIQPFMPTPNHLSGGLAVSEFHRTIFFAASDFTGIAPNNWVFGAPLSNPCQPFCRLQIGGCAGVALGPITGLAFNDCTSEMYITDGRTTLVGRYTPPGGGLACSLQVVSCCTAPVGRWYGLCLEPLHARTIGSSCQQAPCPICPGMALAAVGDAVIGNAAFEFRLTGAPPGTTAVCFVNVGACTPGIPFLCGAIHLPLAPPPVVLGAVVTVGGACAAAANHLLPIPLNPGLCGLDIAAQDLIVCPGPGFGLSNAVCARLSDS